MPLPRIEMAKLLAPTACTGGRAGNFPCHNIDFLSQVQLADIPSQPDQRQQPVGLRRSRRQPRIRGDGPSQRHGGRRRDGARHAGHRRQCSRQCLAVARGEGLPGVDSRAAAAAPAYAYISTEAPGGGLQIIDLTNLPAQRVAGEHAGRVQHLAHAVHLERRLCVDDGACPASRPIYTSRARTSPAAHSASTTSSNPVEPALVTPPPAGTGYMHDSTSMLITDNRTTQCANAHNPCEVLVDFNETVGRSVGRHGQGRAGAPVHHYLSDRDLRALGLADREQPLHHRARRARRAAPRPQHAHLHARHRATCARPAW